MDGGIGDGQNHELPWASIFDPAANVRALTGIQAEGFRAASELVERFVRMATGGVSGAQSSFRPAAPLSAEQRSDLYGATDVEPLMRSWWAMVGQFLLGGVSQTPTQTSTPPANLGFSDGEAKGRLDFDLPVGGTATGELWLHNTAAGDLGRIRLRCGDLTADDGSVVGSAAVTFDPGSVPMPGRSSRGVDITVKVRKTVRPALYRGTVLAEGHPELWLPLALTVRSPVA